MYPYARVFYEVTTDIYESIFLISFFIALFCWFPDM
jgi:hypothetical protein